MRVNGYEIRPYAYLIRPYAYLTDANLTRANLSGANLTKAYLNRANLSGANLSGANLTDAYLNGANLSGANLTDANLFGAYLAGANLADTCLDPMCTPNGDTEGFETYRTSSGVEWVIGYRTKDSPYMGAPYYEEGEYRSAPWFSVASTECHPGLFILPTVELAQQWGKEIIRVYTPAHEVHRAGRKWRCGWFVVGGVI